MSATLAIASLQQHENCSSITWILARENRLLRKAGTEPEVVAYLSLHPHIPNVLDFVIANVGRGPAKNVSFVFKADEEDFIKHEVALKNEEDRTAVNFLPQGESIRLFFGNAVEIFKESRLQPFDVSVKYRGMKGYYHNTTYRLDVSQFSGFVTLGLSPQQEIADILKNIERHFSNVFSGFNRLKVEMITAKEVRQESEKMRIRREQEQAAKKHDTHSVESGDSM